MQVLEEEEEEEEEETNRLLTARSLFNPTNH